MRNNAMHMTGHCQAVGHLAWTLVACAVLLAGCAAQPKSAPPPAQAAQPAPPPAQPAEIAQSTTTPESETDAPPPMLPRQSAVPIPESSETSQAEPAPAPPAKHPPRGDEAAPSEEPAFAKPTVGAQAPRQRERRATRITPVAETAPERQSSAQAAPVAAQSAATPRQQPDQPKPATLKRDEKAEEKSGGCGDTGKAAAPTPSPTGPQPLWVCSEPKCVIEPLWRGENAEFVFTIGNEGEGDLHFRLKCG
ncbi:MAG: hypothetical protein KKI02_09810 [Planctomycetes bacterium]|nr:hypothetical protein [Planctomycetota bacterium]